MHRPPTIAASRLKILMSWVVTLLCVVGISLAPVAGQIAASASVEQGVLESSIQDDGSAGGTFTPVKVESEADAADGEAGSDVPDPDPEDAEDAAEHAVAQVALVLVENTRWVGDALEPPVVVAACPRSHRVLCGGARAPPLC